MYYVTRQFSCMSECRLVEISVGGKDNINPDALSKKYEGEFQEYDNALEAAKAAISIKDQWASSCQEEVKVGVGTRLVKVKITSIEY